MDQITKRFVSISFLFILKLLYLIQLIVLVGTLFADYYAISLLNVAKHLYKCSCVVGEELWINIYMCYVMHCAIIISTVVFQFKAVTMEFYDVMFRFHELRD